LSVYELKQPLYNRNDTKANHMLIWLTFTVLYRTQDHMRELRIFRISLILFNLKTDISMKRERIKHEQTNKTVLQGN